MTVHFMYKFLENTVLYYQLALLKTKLIYVRKCATVHVIECVYLPKYKCSLCSQRLS